MNKLNVAIGILCLAITILVGAIVSIQIDKANKLEEENTKLQLAKQLEADAKARRIATLKVDNPRLFTAIDEMNRGFSDIVYAQRLFDDAQRNIDQRLWTETRGVLADTIRTLKDANSKLLSVDWPPIVLQSFKSKVRVVSSKTDNAAEFLGFFLFEDFSAHDKLVFLKKVQSEISGAISTMREIEQEIQSDVLSICYELK